MIQHTIFEFEGQSELITVIKTKTYHFTIDERNILKSCFVDVHQTQVAALKGAINKFDSSEITR